MTALVMPFSIPHFAQSVERLTLSLFISIIVHLFFTFGIDFDIETASQPRYSTKLDIVLVQSETKEAPEDAQFLAQSNQDGGGKDIDEVRAVTPVRSDFPSPVPEVTSAATIPQLAAAKQVEVDEQLTQEKSTTKIKKVIHQREIKPKPQPKGDAEQTIPLSRSISSADLIMQARDTVASIQADLDEDYRRFQNRPPHKYISARTRASHYAQYMDAWRQKVERIGELNFPDAARQSKLSGSLIMDLALNANGTINYVEIVESSGSTVLDDAAIRIARLGAPYLPFGKSIIEEIGENGILHIIRTWDFDTAGKLHSR